MSSGRVSRRTFAAGTAGLAAAIALGVALSSESVMDLRGVIGSRTTPTTTIPPRVPSPPAPPVDSVFGDHTPQVAKEIALELVSTAENSTTSWRSAYAYIKDIGDGRGYTAGIVGWCSGTGDMLVLVQYYSATTAGNPLQEYIPGLQQIMDASYDDRPDLSHTLLGPPFLNAWRTAAKSAEFQDAQHRERDRVYWGPALAAAKSDGLHATGLYIYYDVSVNQGPETDPESFASIVASVKARGHDSPAEGGDEIDYLTAILAERDTVLQSLVPPGLGGYQVDGRSTIGRRFLSEGNLNLTLPLRWTVYGEAYSITQPPAP